MKTPTPIPSPSKRWRGEKPEMVSMRVLCTRIDTISGFSPLHLFEGEGMGVGVFIVCVT